MKKKLILLFSLILVVTLSSNLYAKQPYSSYWFPNELLKWNAEDDPDAKYNQGSIELAERFLDKEAKVNSNARAEAEVVALSIMHPTTSQNPSQGSNQFDAYTFNYWQYIDKLVMWGGSAAEGTIVSPSADVIDAAHKNGVPVLGTIFLPPNAYGGRLEWFEHLIQKDKDGDFPVADKLIEVAEYYGFDGWFINQETKGTTPEQARQMREFLSYLRKNKDDDMDIMWYDSMTEKGDMDWQNALTEKNDGYLIDEEDDPNFFEKLFNLKDDRLADSMFLNFWWEDMTATREKALELGVDPYSLYAGIDVQANGYQTEAAWDGIFPEGEEHQVSLGLYCPSWTFSSSESNDQFYQKANRFWVGANRNPMDTSTESEWKGIAHYVPAKSAITELPFVTNFNTGNGHFYAVNGRVLRNNDWNNRSLQDILPTWRWIAESEGQALYPEFDWVKAYYGGSSLKVSGLLNSKNATELRLYKTKLEVEENTQLEVVFNREVKNTPSYAQVGLSFADNSQVFLDLGKVGEDAWTKNSIDLADYAGRTITEISLKFSAEEEISDYAINIGRIAVIDNDDVELPEAVSNVRVADLDIVDGIVANLRLTWEKSDDDSLYEIYRVVEDGSREFLGSTYNNAYYLSDLDRRGVSENNTKLEVVAVSEEFRRGNESVAEITFDWGPYPKPTAKFYVDKTFIAPGDTIEFKNESKVADEYKWFFSGGSPLKTKEENPSVTYEKEGTYRVTLLAKNEVGRDLVIKDKLITVSKKAAKEMENIATTGTATASGNVPGETSQMAIDDSADTKWCATGDLPHSLTVDLGEVKKISKFIIKHAEAGGESADFNTQKYHIEMSKDGKEWKEVVNIKNNTAAESENLIKPTRARYVKLTIDKATQTNDTAARIYDFQILAIKNKYKNYAYQKETTASGFVGAEPPSKAVDDTTDYNSKWCVTGDEPHWLEVDLGEVKTVDSFLIKHAEAGGEGAGYNTQDFTIKLSKDGENWEDAVVVRGNKEGITEHPIKATEARYAKLVVENATQGGDTATRIYEFQVLGFKTNEK